MKFNEPVSLNQIALWTNSQIIGDENAWVTGINEIHNVEEGDLTFVDHEKYYDFTLRSKASFIIINKKVDVPQGKILLYNPEPFQAYNLLAKKLKPALISEKSIALSSVIGEGTFIYPNVFIGEKVTIGKNCVVHPNVSIYAYTEIKDNVVIHANTTIGSDAFYFKKRASGFDKMHTAGRVVISKDVEIGAGCTIDAGVSGDTFIGTGTKIDDQVHIGHDVKIGEHCILAGQVGIAGNTRIGNWVTLYGKVAVNKNIEIGDHAVVMATSAVAKSLEGGKSYLGIPAVEARAFAKQNALLKMLPDIWEKLKVKLSERPE